MKKSKLKLARKKIDQLDQRIFNLIRKRTQIIRYMLSLKKFKNEIVDKKRNSEILDTCLERLEGFEEFPQSCTTPLQRIKVKALSNSAWQNIRLGVDVEWARKKLINAYRLSFISFFFPRNMVALLLTLSPNFLIKFFNNILDLLLVRKKQIYK